MLHCAYGDARAGQQPGGARAFEIIFGRHTLLPQAVLAAGLWCSGAVFGCCYEVFKVHGGKKYLYPAISFRVQLSVWSPFFENYFFSISFFNFFSICTFFL